MSLEPCSSRKWICSWNRSMSLRRTRLCQHSLKENRTSTKSPTSALLELMSRIASCCRRSWTRGNKKRRTSKGWKILKTKRIRPSFKRNWISKKKTSRTGLKSTLRSIMMLERQTMIQRTNQLFERILPLDRWMQWRPLITLTRGKIKVDISACASKPAALRRMSITSVKLGLILWERRYLIRSYGKTWDFLKHREKQELILCIWFLFACSQWLLVQF